MFLFANIGKIGEWAKEMSLEDAARSKRYDKLFAVVTEASCRRGLPHPHCSDKSKERSRARWHRAHREWLRTTQVCISAIGVAAVAKANRRLMALIMKHTTQWSIGCCAIKCLQSVEAFCKRRRTSMMFRTFLADKWPCVDSFYYLCQQMAASYRHRCCVAALLKIQNKVICSHVVW